MQINGIRQLHGAQSINSAHAARPSQASAPATASPIRDELSISSDAALLDQLQSLPAIREDRVSAIRAAIADGTYLSQDRLEGAVERLLDEIG